MLRLRLRRPLALLAALSLLCPPSAHAAPPASPEQMAAFEAGFTAGQASFDSGEYLAAVGLWITAAAHLPEVTAHREHRLAVYQYVADAYARGLTDEIRSEPLTAAVAALDAYCEGFTRAYGTETPLDPKIARIRAALQGRLDAAVAIRELQTADSGPRVGTAGPTAPGPAPRPWQGLTIGGGVLLGLGLGAATLAVAGAVRGRSLEARFDDPANLCELANLHGNCADLHADGKRSNSLAIAGLVLGPLLLGGGAALLALGLKRRSNRPRHAVVPALGPGFVGLRLGGRF